MKRRRRSDLWLLALLIAAGFLLGKLQSSARNSGDTDIFSRSVRVLVNPLANGLSWIARTTNDFGNSLGQAYSLQQENRRLQALASIGRTYQVDIQRLQIEVDQLRKLGGWQDKGQREKVPADVIALFPHENRITLNVGSSSGVKRGMPVATYQGLVGRVETVEKNSCQALLITAPSKEPTLSALVQRKAPNPPPAGLIRGNSSTRLILELADPTSVVEPGDTVVTSGFSEQIPRGLPIGTVLSVEDDLTYGRRTATVFPMVPLGSLREVVVVK